MDDAFGRRVTKLGALADPVRRALYRFVARPARPRSAATRRPTGSANARHTAKFHLDRLVEEGLLVTEFQRLTGRPDLARGGRPSSTAARAARSRSRLPRPAATTSSATCSPTPSSGPLGGEAMTRPSGRGDRRRHPGRRCRGAPARAPPELERWPAVLEPFGYEPRVDRRPAARRTVRSTASPPTTPTSVRDEPRVRRRRRDGLGCAGVRPSSTRTRSAARVPSSANAPGGRVRRHARRCAIVGAMGKQEDFVLRALEERDVRFVRLWFTDVLGFLKSVAVAPAELEGAFDEGIGFDGSAIEGFARVYEADMLAKPDPSTFQILPWRRRGPVDRPDVLRHRDARRLPVVRRPALRPQAHAEQGRRPGLHLLHPPRDRVLPVQGHPERRRRAGAGRPQRLLRPHRAVDGRRLPPRGDHDARVDGHLGGVQPPRGRPGPAGDRPALRRRAQHRRQHHDLPHRDPGGGAEPGHLGDVHAQAVHHPPRLGHAHARLALRGRPQRVLRGRRRVPALQDRPPVHRRHPAPRQRDQPASPTSGSTATSG